MNNFKDSHYPLPYMWMHFKNRVLQLNPYEGMTFLAYKDFFQENIYQGNLSLLIIMNSESHVGIAQKAI
jgi:hypothetical protein